MPPLTLFQYYQRLFTLDKQVQYLRQKGLQSCGMWLARKWKDCQQRKSSAAMGLERCQTTVDELLELWHAQVEYQTRPLKQVSRTSAQKALEDIISQVALKGTYTREINALEKKIAKGSSSSDQSPSELLHRRQETVSKREALEAAIEEKKRNLGIQGQSRLRSLLSNRFLQVRLNARALKQRIRARLISRKFELERFERAAYSSSSGEQSLQSHIQSQVQRHQPNITKLVKRYNDLCVEMEGLIESQQAPAGSHAPKQLDRDSLFSMDVDAGIWNDAGLGDDEVVPLWMGDEKVQDGIRHLLVFQRCMEEEERLVVEYWNMVGWLNKEWAAVCQALEKCGMLCLNSVVTNYSY